MTGIGLHLGITEFCGETQIRHINLISMLPHTQQEVLRLDVTMDDALGMDVFETVKELIGEHQHGLEREFAAAVVEKIFQTRPQEIEHHRVVFTFGLIRVDSWNTGTTGKGSIDVDFAFEERGIDEYVFEFDGDFITSIDVDSLRVMSSRSNWHCPHLLPMYTAPKLPPPILLRN